MNKIGIFFENPFRLAGTETWIRNIAREYHDKYDITVYYPDNLVLEGNAPQESVDFLQGLVKCVAVETGEPITVDIALWAYDYFHFNWVTAKKKYLFIHPGDGHGSHPKTPEGYTEFTEVIAVSNYTKNKMKEWAGIDCRVIYNPVPPQKLHFISLSRVAKDKGWARCRKLAKALKDRGIDFQWDIYTDYPAIKDKLFTPQAPTIDAIDKIKQSDFLVQLSDHESFGYSMVEGLQYSKLIVTDIEILPEMGITKDNAVIVPLKNADYDKVVDDILARTYTPPQTDYSVIFGKPSKQNKVLIVINNTDMDIYLSHQDRWVSSRETAVVDDDKEVRDNLKRLIFIEKGKDSKN